MGTASIGVIPHARIPVPLQDGVLQSQNERLKNLPKDSCKTSCQTVTVSSLHHPLEKGDRGLYPKSCRSNSFKVGCWVGSKFHRLP